VESIYVILWRLYLTHYNTCISQTLSEPTEFYRRYDQKNIQIQLTFIGTRCRIRNIYAYACRTCTRATDTGTASAVLASATVEVWSEM